MLLCFYIIYLLRHENIALKSISLLGLKMKISDLEAFCGFLRLSEYSFHSITLAVDQTSF